MIYSFSAEIFPDIFVIAASYAECDKISVVIWFILAMGVMDTYYPSMRVNCLELRPNYAGSIMAIANVIGALTEIGKIDRNLFLKKYEYNIQFDSNLFA